MRLWTIARPATIISVLLLLPITFAVRPHPPTKRDLSPSIPTNQTSSSPTTQNTSLTFSPWPPLPISVALPSRDDVLTIGDAKVYTSRPSIPLPELLDFIKIFIQNLLEAHPALAPRTAKASHIDLTSYTSWELEFTEQILSTKFPTQTVVSCLEYFRDQIRRHGASSIFAVLHKNSRLAILKFVNVNLSIKELVPGVANGTFSRQSVGFQTS